MEYTFLGPYLYFYSSIKFVYFFHLCRSKKYLDYSLCKSSNVPV